MAARHRDRWFLYSLASPQHYEELGRFADGDAYRQAVAARLPGWTLARSGVTILATPPDPVLVRHGWKIHCSATLPDAEAVLTAVCAVTGALGVPFKFAAGPALHCLVNSASWPRAASGKFVTIYPRTEDEFTRLAHELAHRTENCAGPRILSDRRVEGSVVVHYRYGGHIQNDRLRWDGRREAVLVSPDGTVVPDHRMPYWACPDWAVDPLRAEAPSPAPMPPAARGSTDSIVLQGRYEVTSAMRLSSAGGVYRARDTSGRLGAVVLREGRPLVHRDVFGHDAAQRIDREHDLLRALEGTGVPPRAFQAFGAWEHRFLAEEYLSEWSLFDQVLARSPIIRVAPRGEEWERYRGWFRAFAAELARVVVTLTQRGLWYPDLSNVNVRVTDAEASGRVRLRLIDLAAAGWKRDLPAAPDPLTLVETTPGFRDRMSQPLDSPWCVSPFAVGSLLVSALMPVTALFDVAPQRATAVAAHLLEEYRLDDKIAAAVLALLAGREALDELAAAARTPSASPLRLGLTQVTLPGDAAAVATTAAAKPMAEPQRDARDSEIQSWVHEIWRYADAHATPERVDRLVPGDPSAFESNGVCVAHGAAGVVHARIATCGWAPTEWVDWLADRLDRQQSALPTGLYTGLAGAAWALAEAGRRDQALDVMRNVMRRDDHSRTWDVFYGAAGVGLAALHLHAQIPGSDDLLDFAARLGDRMAKAAGRSAAGLELPPAEGPDLEAGYALGYAGVAAFLLYLSAATGMARYRQTGRRLLQTALDDEVQDGRGHVSIAARRNYRFALATHYWYQGTAGVIAAALRFHAVEPEPELAAQIDRLLPDLTRAYTIFPSLCKGMAGLGDTLLDASVLLKRPSLRADALATLQRLRLFAVPRDEGLAFPGEQLMRLSVDWMTGSAGIAAFAYRCQAGAAAGLSWNLLPDEILGLPDDMMRGPGESEGQR